jgi:hypothetical protein
MDAGSIGSVGANLIESWNYLSSRRAKASRVSDVLQTEPPNGAENCIPEELQERRRQTAAFERFLPSLSR